MWIEMVSTTLSSEDRQDPSRRAKAWPACTAFAQGRKCSASARILRETSSSRSLRPQEITKRRSRLRRSARRHSSPGRKSGCSGRRRRPRRSTGAPRLGPAQFSEWVRWEDRAALAGRCRCGARDCYGVYLIAHFDAAPPKGPASFLDDAIIYVGESKRVLVRWGEFERSALGGVGHSGGITYHAKFGPLRPQVHVAVWNACCRQPDGSVEQPTTSFMISCVEGYIATRIALHRRGRDVAPLLNKSS
jgi:hypothetical protein